MKLYIDPGTGSMLFAILIGAFGAVYWLLKGLLVKIKFAFSKDKDVLIDNNIIPFVIFSDDKRYWNVFKPICEELNNREFDVTYYTASPDDPALECDLKYFHPKFIGEGNKAFAKLNMLNATILFSTTPGLNVYQWKRSKNVKYYIHTLHACGDVSLYRMFALDYYDSVMLSGEYQVNQVRELEKLRNLPKKEIALVGIPYMDEMLKRLQESQNEAPITSSGTTVLVAPSWGKNSILNKFGEKFIDALLKTDYNIIIRPHPQSFTSEKEMMDTLMAKYPNNDKLTWNRDNDNFEVLKNSDIMISDFSGVIFDFSLVYDKPVIYTDTSFDKSPYDAAWLDSPLWNLESLPKIGEKLTEDNFDNLASIIERCLSDKKYSENREIVRNETWCSIGDGAKNSADYIINKYAELTEVK